jgi:murein DD-endopeptidase MepM/ murein hydrolase activator NlpD
MGDGLIELRRHAPVGRARALPERRQHRRLADAYIGRSRRRTFDIYASDHAESRRSGRFRWLISTCLAAAVGGLAILVVIAGSTDTGEFGLLPALQRMPTAPLTRFVLPSARIDGLRWAVPKADRMQVASGAMATKFIIHDSMRQRRNNREYVVNKPYARIVARLAPVPPSFANRIPPFNPYKLYAAQGSATDADAGADEGSQNIAVKVVELLGGILPGEDGQELDTQEVTELVARVKVGDEDQHATIRPGFEAEGLDRFGAQGMLADRSQLAPESLPPNTSVQAKTVFETDDIPDDLEAREVRVVKVARGDTLVRILTHLGAETWEARAMVDAARHTFPESALVPGQEVHVTLVPSITQANRSEPARFSVFTEGHDHKVTVARNAAGEFVTSNSPIDERIARAALENDDLPQASSLYASLHYAAQTQGLSSEAILQIIRIHAYETDFRRRVRTGDAVEFFFDLVDPDKGADSSLGELLSTAITSGGETQRFYRFRTADGVVDYYDESGNTSRKFLMRRPVRGEAVRLASGFGYRRHPALLIMRMHTGVDWSAPPGTPIMAAGSGVVEEARYKGEYGNYIRIRHANGYSTAYGHLARYAPGLVEGLKVRQGEVIGFVGSTGLSTGPHVHFEVLINNRHVDPMSIQVPRERQLVGKQLADFQKERARIDDLLRRSPVSAKVAEMSAVR